MAEKVGWWTVGTVVVGGMFGLCLFGFTFLNGRVDASEKIYRAEIREVRAETSVAIKELRSEISSRFDKLDGKIDMLRK